MINCTKWIFSCYILVVSGCGIEQTENMVSGNTKQFVLSEPLSSNSTSQIDYVNLLIWAREETPFVRNALAEYNRSQSELGLERSRRLPRFSVSSNLISFGDIESDASLNVTQSIWDGGRRAASIARAEIESALFFAQFELSKIEAMEEFISLYFSWLRSYTSEKIRSRYLERMIIILTSVKGEVESGLLSVSELQDIQARIDRNQRLLLQEQTNKEQALALLEKFMGLSLDENKIAIDIDGFFKNKLSGSNYDDKEHNQIYLAASNLSVELAQFDVENLSRQFFPEVSLVGRKVFTSLNRDTFASSEGVGVSFNFELTNSQTRTALTDRVIASEVSARALRDEQKTRFESNISRWEKQLLSSSERVLILREALGRASISLTSIQRQYNSRTVGWEKFITAILDSQNIELAERENVLQSVQSSELLKIYLFSSTGDKPSQDG